MDDELLDFCNLLSLKNHLATATEKDLVDLYQDVEDYVTFIDIFVLLTETDSGFLLLDEGLVDRVNSVLQVHRFDIDDKEIKDIINSIIGYLNRVRTMDSSVKNILKNNYLAYHEELREATFGDNESFLAAISYDAIVVKALLDGDMNLAKDNKFIVMSLNYLIKVCPELFKRKEVKDNAEKLLDKCMKGNKLFDGCSRHAKDIKVKIKELENSDN